MRNAYSGRRRGRGGGGGGVAGPRAKSARLGDRGTLLPGPRVGHGRPKEDCMGLRAPHGVAFRGANRAGRFLALPDGSPETLHRVSGPS
jgi:hypothetical protein